MARMCEINVNPVPLPPEGGLHLHETKAHIFLGIDACDGDNERADGGLVPRHRRIEPHD
jgi:hypothetical protein